MVKRWTESEEEKIRLNYPVMPLSELMKMFPDRTGDSIDKKAYKLGLRKAGNYSSRRGEVVSVKDRVLSTLESEMYPITIDDLKENCEISKTRELKRIIANLDEDGYDIKEISGGSGTSYVLVRTGGADPEMYYNFQGEIETPVLMTSDWHIGSRLHSRLGFEKMLETIEEYSVATVMIDGDMFQGMGVYRREAGDLRIFRLEDQKDVGADYLKEIPSCVKDIGITIGNHESVAKEKHQVGYDMCKAVAKEDSRATYYGHVAKVLLDGDWDYTMMHTEGAVGYATSYKGQRIRDNLIQRPHVLHFGHIHQGLDHPRPHTSGRASTITSFSLAREGGWQMQKGNTSIVGWYILNRWSPTHKSMDEFVPRVF